MTDMKLTKNSKKDTRGQKSILLSFDIAVLLCVSICVQEKGNQDTHNNTLTCSLSPLCTRGQKPLATGQH